MTGAQPGIIVEFNVFDGCYCVKRRLELLSNVLVCHQLWKAGPLSPAGFCS